MKLKIQLSFVLVCFLLINQKVEAQQIPVELPIAPSVWEFAKYGNVPADEYRGLVNVGIPIYSINMDNVNIPINLSYYSGGIRVTDEAGIVGLGWSMNFPTIVQSVKDLNDYDLYTRQQKLPPYQGNPAVPSSGVYNINCNGGMNTNVSSFIGVIPIQNIPYYQYVYNNGILVDGNGYYNTDFKYFDMLQDMVDSEPDIFTVNLNGTEIKFSRIESQYDQKTPQNTNLLPLQIINGRTEYKIDLLPINSNQSFNLKMGGILITDPSGNEFYFDKIEKVSSGGTYNFIYKLSRIKTFQDKEILFNYTQGNVVGINKANPKTVRRNGDTQSNPSNLLFDKIGFHEFDGNNTLYIYNNDGLNPLNNSLTHDSQNYYFLQSISTPYEEINFTYGNRIDYLGMKKIDFIEIKNNRNEKIKKYNLSYDYFDSSFDNTNHYIMQNFDNVQNNQNLNDRFSKRLKLLSVQLEGENPYVFEYNSSNLPKKNSYATDYWGFYNGHNNLSFKLDLTQFGYPLYNENTNNNFNSNLNFCKAASLETIIYPTKGKTSFIFELNEFDNLLFNTNSNYPIINKGAGLRIKKIINKDYDETIISEKSFEYFGGKCISKRILVNEYNYTTYDCTKEVDSKSTPVITTTLNNFVGNSSSYSGDYIGYDRVIIKDSQDNGFVEKEFSNNSFSFIHSVHNMFPKMDYYDHNNCYLNGNLLKEKTYNSNNILQLEKVSFYKSLNYILSYGMNKLQDKTLVDICGKIIEIRPSCNGVIYNSRYLLTFYPVNFKSSIKEKEIVTEFFGNKSKSTITTYDYNLKNLISNIKSFKNSIGATPFSEKSYIYTYNHPFLSSLSTLHSSNNILTLPAIITEKENNVLKSEMQYSYDSYALKTRVKELNTIYDTQINSNEKTFFDEYDEKNNILQYHKENNINTCIIWGYNKTLPVAKIENATYSSISSSLIQAIQDASDTGSESQLLTQLENLRISLPNAIVTCYTHKPLIGVSTMIDSRGNKVKYHYDSNNRLEFIEDNDSNVLSENEYHYKD